MTLKRATDDLIRAIYNSYNQNTGGTVTIETSSIQHQDTGLNSNITNSIIVLYGDNKYIQQEIPGFRHL